MNWTGTTHAFKSSTWEEEAGRNLWVQGQPDLPGEYQDSRAYIIETMPQKKKKKGKEKITVGSCMKYVEF